MESDDEDYDDGDNDFNDSFSPCWMDIHRCYAMEPVVRTQSRGSGLGTKQGKQHKLSTSPIR